MILQVGTLSTCWFFIHQQTYIATKTFCSKFLKMYGAMGGKLPPRCITCSVSVRDKITNAILMFLRVSFSTVSCQPSLVISLPWNSDGAWKEEVVSLWHVCMNDIWVDCCFAGQQMNATIVIQTRIHLDVTVQDGGGKAQ